jgi:hypothetical protein
MPDPVIPPTSEEDGLNPDGTPKVKGTPPKPEDAPKFTQADLDRIAAKTREEERRKAKEAKEKEDRERAEAEAKEQGKFEKLANDRQAKIEELEPKVTALETERNALKVTLGEILDADLKSLPEKVRDTSPAVYADDGKTLTNPQAVLAWLPKGKALAAELDGQPAKPGAKLDPKAKGAPGEADRDKRAASEARRAYRN